MVNANAVSGAADLQLLQPVAASTLSLAIVGSTMHTQ
jgi:hypothetical protein